MPAGNCSAQNTEFNLTVKCNLIKLSEVMLSTLSSVNPELENTSQDQFSSIWSQLLLMKSEPYTDNYSTQNNKSPEKKMLPTTSSEDITPSEKISLICAKTESEIYPTTVLVSKVYQSSTPQKEEPDLNQDHYCQKDYQLITERNPNQDSPYTHLHKSKLTSLNHTTASYLPTPYQNKPMFVLCQITKPSMISAEESQISKDPLVPT